VLLLRNAFIQLNKLTLFELLQAVASMSGIMKLHAKK